MNKSKLPTSAQGDTENWETSFPQNNPTQDTEVINKIGELEMPITENEIWHTVKNSSVNKTTGSAGFTIEFYVTYWIDIKDYLLRCFNRCYNK